MYLLESLNIAATRFIRDAFAANGDFTVAGDAVAELLRATRQIAMSKALDLATINRPTQIRCPCCQCEVNAWRSGARQVVTAQGAGTYERLRYHCNKCGKDYYPTEVANGLVGTSFTLDARKVIAAAAAVCPYTTASTALWENRALPVSAKEVDTIVREIGALVERNGQELVDAQFGLEAAKRRFDNPDTDPLDSVPALHELTGWLPSEPAIVSVDGAHVRSTTPGVRGKEWFECRSGIIAPASDEGRGRTIYVGGYLTPDALFDRLASTYNKSGGNRDIYFLADGAEWIWIRARLHFPSAIQILDIYHASEHVGSAAAAAWGEGAEITKEWRKDAKGMLLKPEGLRPILRPLIKQLRAYRAEGNTSKQADDLLTEIRYFLKNRERTRYYKFRQLGYPIGSGAMESAIKQLSTQRLRQPGMMWTRKGANAMLHLRAAHLSQALDGVVSREASKQKATAASYYLATHKRAA
jgi:hypothetical protein